MAQVTMPAEFSQTTPARPVPAGASLARAFGWAAVGLAILAVFYAAVLAGAPDAALLRAANSAGPLTLLATSAALALRVARAEPVAVWTGAFWFPAQSAVFFGFGPLVEVLGSGPTRAFLGQGALPVTPVELLRTNLLSTVGICAVLAGFGLHLGLRPDVWAAARTSRPGRAAGPRPETLGLVFILCGAALKYAIVKPAEWGMIPVLVPGVINSLVYMQDVGFGIAAYLAGLGRRRMAVAFFALWPLHFGLSVLSLAKIELVLALLFPLIGYFAARHNRLILVAGLCGIGIAFAAAQPLVKYGRFEIINLSGTISQATYGERAVIVGQYLTGPGLVPETAATAGVQRWWTRLSFAGAQASAMHLRDRGAPLDSLDAVWMRFVPRALWPEKPVIVSPALEFYRRSTGNHDGSSFLAVTVYGDLYMQFGWAGVVLICPLIGWLFALLSVRALRAMRMQAFLLLPAVLLALRMALQGPNGFLVTGIIGPLPIYLAYSLACAGLLAVMAEPALRSARINRNAARIRALAATRVT